MKKRFSIIAMVMALVMLVGCSQTAPATPATPEKEETPAPSVGTEAEAETKELTFGVTYYEMCEWINLADAALQEVAAENNIKINAVNAQWDASTQLSQIENMIANEVDAIIMAPTDSDATAPAIKMCEDAGIPLVVMNNSINTDEFYYFVGANEVQGGETMTKAMVEALGGKGNLVVLECILGTGYEVGRTQGMHNILKDYPDIKILDHQPCNGQRNLSVDQMENWIEVYGDEIDGVIAQCDEMALGAIIAMESAGMEGIPVVSIDGTKDGITAVKDGKMTMTCYQDAIYEGTNALLAAKELATGGKPALEKDVIEMIPIFQADAGKYLDELFS